MKIYLAGPDVFRPMAADYGSDMKLVCKALGHEGLFPLDNEVKHESKDMASEIYQGNFDMIKDCDVILANIQRFRGASLDPGTAWEIGVAKALGKRVVLYGHDGKNYCDVAKASKEFPHVESFGLYDNLMIIKCADMICKDFFEAIRSI